MGIAVAGVALASAALVGCSDNGPKCISSHMEWQPVMSVGPKGTVSTHMVFYPVCDKYETPTPSAKP
jgi:hypothetical protein